MGFITKAEDTALWQNGSPDFWTVAPSTDHPAPDGTMDRAALLATVDHPRQKTDVDIVLVSPPRLIRPDDTARTDASGLLPLYPARKA